MINFPKKKELLLIATIILFAYFLRILPYLFGYPIPFTEDGILDFGQVKYLLENNQINFSDQDLNFGSFPVLHLLIFFLSKTGLPALKLFLFIPQIFSVLGILFFYLFVRRYVSPIQSRLAIFLISLWIPHIHWSAQPVRETMGLFFFGLIIYLSDRLGRGKNWKLWLTTLIAILLMVASHHWSTIMLLIWLAGFNIVFIKDRTEKKSYRIITAILIVLTLIYWITFFPLGVRLSIAPLKLSGYLWLMTAVIMIMAMLLIIKTKLTWLGNKKIKIIGLLFFLILLAISGSVSPLLYPLQIWLSLAIFFALFYIGLYYYQDGITERFVLLSACYLLPWLIVIPYLLLDKKLINMPIDPFRTTEFIIFPASVVIAKGVEIIAADHRKFTTVIFGILIFLATLTYPPIFIYHSSWYGTPFYDVRSQIRYISPEVRKFIDWANKSGFSVDSLSPEARAYQKIFYPLQDKKVMLITANDKLLGLSIGKIKDPIMKIGNVTYWLDEKNQTPIYANGDSKLVQLKYDSKFIDQGVPAKMISGQAATAWIKMKNTGTEVWRPEDGIKMIYAYDKSLVMELTKSVKPGEDVVFTFNQIIPDYSGLVVCRWQLFHPAIGAFGESSPPMEITIEK